MSIDTLREQFFSDIQTIKTLKDIEQIKINYLGKKGSIAALMQSLKNCSKEERPKLGKAINDLKIEITKAIDEALSSIEGAQLNERLIEETIDISLPGLQRSKANVHPLTQMINHICSILTSMGFSIEYSPEIESEFYNYGGLNYPEDHPARDMQDTYYLTKDMLLRSHTTSIQQRIMESHKPPIRIASPGKCYRNETISTRSHVIFHQVDALYIDKNVTFADLLATKEEFYSRIFNKKIKVRVRPSYFPFVEPGMEVDIACTNCEQRGCKLCKHTGWLEVAGAGMVHPEVLRQGGVDPDKYSGYAWGGGVERLFMLKYGIEDIRQFMENDLRFLSQFT